MTAHRSRRGKLMGPAGTLTLTLTLVLTLAAALVSTLPSASGQAPAAENGAPGKPAAASKPSETKPVPPLTPEQARKASLAADTARLYQLAQELKVEVDKSTKDTMSLAVIKKAAEVEKLAHDLKERMKNETPKSR